MPGSHYPLEPLLGKIISPFERFIRQTTSGGIVLMGMTMLTLIIASSPLGDAFRHIWEVPVRFAARAFSRGQVWHYSGVPVIRNGRAYLALFQLQ